MGLQDHQNGPPEHQNHTRKYQNGDPRPPKIIFVLMFSNACHTNHQMHVDRGPAAEGVALKIRRTPRRGAAGRDGITTEVLAVN